MATKTLNYSLEFKQKIVALYRSGQTQNKLAREYGLELAVSKSFCVIIRLLYSVFLLRVRIFWAVWSSPEGNLLWIRSCCMLSSRDYHNCNISIIYCSLPDLQLDAECNCTNEKKSTANILRTMTVAVVAPALLIFAVCISHAQSSERLIVTFSPPWLWLVQNITKGLPVKTVLFANTRDTAHQLTITPSKMRNLLKADLAVINELFGSRTINFEKVSEMRGSHGGVIAVNRALQKEDLIFFNVCAHERHNENKAKHGAGEEKNHSCLKNSANETHKLSLSQNASSTGVADPHIWLSPIRLRKIASSIARTVAEIFPGESVIIQANLEQVTAKLSSMEEKFKSQIDGNEVVNTVVWHDAWAYFRKDFGLPEAVKANFADIHNAGISVQRATEIKKILAELNNGCLLVSSLEVLENEAKMVAEGTGTKFAVIDPSGSMLPQEPESLFKLLETTLEAHLSCASSG